MNKDSGFQRMNIAISEYNKYGINDPVMIDSIKK